MFPLAWPIFSESSRLLFLSGSACERIEDSHQTMSAEFSWKFSNHIIIIMPPPARPRTGNGQAFVEIWPATIDPIERWSNDGHLTWSNGIDDPIFANDRHGNWLHCRYGSQCLFGGLHPSQQKELLSLITNLPTWGSSSSLILPVNSLFIARLHLTFREDRDAAFFQSTDGVVLFCQQSFRDLSTPAAD